MRTPRWSCQSDRRRRPHGPATNPAHGTVQGPQPRPTSHVNMYQRRHPDELALASRASDLHISDTAQQQPWSHRPPRTTRQGRAPPSPPGSTKAQCTKRFSSRLGTRPAVTIRPPVNGTPPNERASCITSANAGSRIAARVAALNPRQSVHSPPKSQVKRQLSAPPTPSLPSWDRGPHARLA